MAPHMPRPEALAMTEGMVALGLYSALVCDLLMTARWRGLPATLACLLVWLAAAFGLLQLGRLIS
jgi:hypothetical protein